MMERYNQLTESEFLLLKGTDKIATMLSNKFYTVNPDLVGFLNVYATHQFCVIPEGKTGWFIYFESMDDVGMVRASMQPETPEAPPIHTINIVDEFKK